jgi:N-acyl homoserine lactone hydrolase
VKIHTLTTGTVRIKHSQLEPRHPIFPVQILRLLRDPNWTVPLPINAFLIEHPEGPILVDTGDVGGLMPSGIPRQIAKKFVQPHEEIGAQLKARGIAAKDLTVVLTHLHGDHTGGLPQLKGARILVAKKEFENAYSLMGRISSIPETLPANFKPELFEFTTSPIQNFSQSYPLAENVWVIPTPGHTNNHVSVLIKRDDHWIVIAGDAAYSLSQMLHGNMDGMNMNPRATVQSVREIKTFCANNKTIFLPCHDPESAHRLEHLEFVQV